MHVDVVMIKLGNSRDATISFGLLQLMLLVRLVGVAFVRKSLY